MATSRQVRNASWAAVLAIVALAVVLTVVLRGGANDPEASPASDGTAATSPAATSAAPDSTPTTAPPTSAKPSGTEPTTTSPVPPESKPVPVDEVARTPDGVRVAIAKSEAVAGKARFAGEISGPALRLTIEIRNASKEPLDLAYVVVNAYSGKDRAPTAPIAAPGGRPMSGTLQPGETADGVYLFTVPKAERGNVRVGVDYRAGEPTVVFRGAFPG